MNELIRLILPVDGKVMPLSEVNDYLFNKKIMGEGIAIYPEGNFIYSPADGEITLVYEYKHAIAIKTKEGIQILIHVGIDSVKLEGRGFANYVKVGDKVKCGDKLMFFDKEFIEMNVSPIIPIVITNSELIDNIDINYKASKVGETLLTITMIK
ncbi:PTS system, glucose-specific IIA component/PTS system, sucrose-specific IIC component [Clostridium sp. USBA 49]|jgi:glucose-specific phosphotransferase system IIA component|uniref:PTS sugar transporter subunit IIA n=1 Tax=Clostridium TaxID=1485 RepID=UPI00099A4FEB|nr:MULTISPECIES: PTS glucose transporter subunit IIA [Clostridium]SKA76614.1 PTS system, glucose-specific IIA component/PTS system, sucrose-specific IIC component [Clostridium sp. USBA 49]